MLRRWLCQADLTLRLTPLDPVLIKSGYATVDGPDMVPVQTYKDGKSVYYFPGTSLKGVLRSRIERIARTLRPGSVCIPYYEGDKQRERIPVESEKRSFGCGHRLKKAENSAQAYAHSCAVCRMFGSLVFGGRFTISDAYPPDDSPPKHEQRDGVGIDRFTGGSASGALFNLVVIVGGSFEARVQMTNFETWQLAALYFLLMDLQDEQIQIGSGRSRGLGRIKGEVTRFQLSYASPTSTLLGLFDLATHEERSTYRLPPWQPCQAIALPESSPRGIRHVHDVSDSWSSMLEPLAPSFDLFLEYQGALRTLPVIA